MKYCDNVYRNLKFAKNGWDRGDRVSHHLQQPPHGVTWEICITIYVNKTNLLMAAKMIKILIDD